MNNTTLAINALQISPEREQYNHIRLKYQNLAEKVASVFSAQFSELFHDADALHEKCEGTAHGYLMQTVDEAIKDLIAQGISDVDDESFLETYMKPHLTWADDFGEFDEKYMTIVLKTEQLDEYRTGRREGRGKWVGGGFGVSGALKGAAEAAAMNAVTGIAHGVWNLGAKAMTAMGDAHKKKALYEDLNTKNQLVRAVYHLIFNVHMALVDAVNDKRPGSVTGYVSEEDVDKSARLLENILKGRVPETAVRRILLESLSLNPYRAETYKYWIQAFGDDIDVMEKTANYFGVREIAADKRELFENKCRTLDWSSLENCRSNLTQLDKYASSIGYFGFDEFKNKCLADAEAQDLASRTFNGKLYLTCDDAKLAHLDLDLRTFKGITYSTREEADNERSKRSVGILLGLGIALMPYIFSFFTLRKGHSQTARVISIGWLIFFIALILFSPKQPENAEKIAKTASTKISTTALASTSEVIAPPVAPTTTTSESVVLPFIGKRYFNFAGGSGTGQTITIQADGATLIESHGTSGSFVDYKDVFTNPIQQNDGSSLLIEKNSVFLIVNGKIETGCAEEGKQCVSDFYTD